jgi:hypothetical protein
MKNVQYLYEVYDLNSELPCSLPLNMFAQQQFQNPEPISDMQTHECNPQLSHSEYLNQFWCCPVTLQNNEKELNHPFWENQTDKIILPQPENQNKRGRMAHQNSGYFEMREFNNSPRHSVHNPQQTSDSSPANSVNNSMPIEEFMKGKRDMVNYDVLRGHKFEIKINPNKDWEKNTRIYVCKYDNWNKVFNKTWNLVYHFRIHTNHRPYKCKECGKGFTQGSNLKRHLLRHENNRLKNKVMHKCYDCHCSYTTIYNLRVSFWFSTLFNLMV